MFMGAQVADFGSARSASQEGYHWAEQGPPEPRNAQLAGPNSLHTITVRFPSTIVRSDKPFIFFIIYIFGLPLKTAVQDTKSSSGLLVFLFSVCIGIELLPFAGACVHARTCPGICVRALESWKQRNQLHEEE